MPGCRELEWSDEARKVVRISLIGPEPAFSMSI